MPAATTETIEVDAPPEEAFAYVANFGNLDDWDPTFDTAVRTDTGPLGVGSSFRVATRIAGRDVAIDYRITEFRRDEHVVLVGTAASRSSAEGAERVLRPAGAQRGQAFTSTDTIEFAARGNGGTRVTYHAEVDTDAPDWLDTAATPIFAIVGKLSAVGMRDALSDDRD